ncbi:hypothetical protein ABPG74_015398 [Tetrahymena malaccensis]
MKFYFYDTFVAYEFLFWLAQDKKIMIDSQANYIQMIIIKDLVDLIQQISQIACLRQYFNYVNRMPHTNIKILNAAILSFKRRKDFIKKIQSQYRDFFFSHIKIGFLIFYSEFDLEYHQRQQAITLEIANQNYTSSQIMFNRKNLMRLNQLVKYPQISQIQHLYQKEISYKLLKIIQPFYLKQLFLIIYMSQLYSRSAISLKGR